VADTVLLGQGLEGAFGWDPLAVTIIVTVGAALLAIFGHDWLHKAFRIILYVTLPIMAVFTVGIMIGAASANAAPMEGLGFVWAGFIAQVTACAACNITYAPYVSDYSRYLPSTTKPRAVITSVFFGASTSAIWLIIIGAWLAITLGVTDGLAGIQMAGNAIFSPLGNAAAFLMALALAATMGMNAYGGMLTVVTMIHSFSPVKLGRRTRVIVIIALAAAWFLIASLIDQNAIGVVFSALTLMLYVLVP
jgi:NCS1 family nucleobase:cation symporter-1